MNKRPSAMESRSFFVHILLTFIPENSDLLDLETDVSGINIYDLVPRGQYDCDDPPYGYYFFFATTNSPNIPAAIGGTNCFFFHLNPHDASTSIYDAEIAYSWGNCIGIRKKNSDGTWGSWSYISA